LGIRFAPSASAATGVSPVHSFVRSAGPTAAARTLIVVNGGPGLDSQQMFRAFKRLATPARRVVAYDQRGVDRTPAPNTPLADYSVDAFVADLEALRIRLGAKRIDLLGHSFGSLIASAYTATYPERVRSLTLVSGLPVSLSAQYAGDARFEKRLADLQRTGVVPRQVPGLCAARNAALLPVYLGDPRRARAVATLLGPSRCSDVVSTLANDAIEHDPLRPKLAIALARYRGPALIVIGARDPFGTVWANDDAAPLRNAHVTKRVLPRAGHFVWLESAEFFPLLRGFLARQ
jgi:proline iminopeptidase